MYRFFRFLRFLLVLGLVGAVIGAVAYAISTTSYTDAVALYNQQVTAIVQTAVRSALYDATRTAEAPLDQYRLVLVTANDSLESVAEQYGTTPAAIRMANGLAPDIFYGAGDRLIIPQGVAALDPPRRLEVYIAVNGDTLSSIATQSNVPLTLLEMDNPVLAAREVLPGDIVFVANLL